MRTSCGMLAWLLATSCISVPPAEDPPVSARKATAVVDSAGRTIEGGNLVIKIPAGALDEGERITVTIDSVRGAPGRHLGDAYLVAPEGQTFNLPLLLSYKYREAYVEDVIDMNALFLGVAVGASWQPLAAPGHDREAMTVAGEVMHFSTFGLVDPNAPLDAGVPTDASGRDLDRPDAGARDHSAADANRVDSAVGSNQIQVQLTWTGASADFDLHLLRVDGTEFSYTDDCYYASCKSTPLEWPPAGSGGNPLMDIDDVNGYGPENIILAAPGNETYVAGVHLFDNHDDTLPIGYTLKIFWRGNLVLTINGSTTRCDDYVDVADIVVSGNGNSVSTTARSDTPAPGGSGSCVFTDQ